MNAKYRITSTLDIIIVNWNTGDLLEKCLRSIDQYGAGIASSVVVVDNGSIDGSANCVDTVGMQIDLLQNKDNDGFGRACNQGAASSNADYLLFLNPDTELLEDSLAIPLEFMESNAGEAVGICSIQLLDEDGDVSRSCSRFPTVSRFVAGATGIDRVFPRIGRDMVEWDHTTTRNVDQVIGAFFLVRRNLFEELGGFDERFFVYFEEVDFACRASDIGSKSVFLASAQAFHVGGGSSRNVKASRLFYSWRSRLLYGFKHFAWPGSVALLLLTVLVEPISRSVFACVRLSWNGLRETWLACAKLWLWLPQWALKGVTR